MDKKSRDVIRSKRLVTAGVRNRRRRWVKPRETSSSSEDEVVHGVRDLQQPPPPARNHGEEEEGIEWEPLERSFESQASGLDSEDNQSLSSDYSSISGGEDEGEPLEQGQEVPLLDGNAEFIDEFFRIVGHDDISNQTSQRILNLVKKFKNTLPESDFKSFTQERRYRIGEIPTIKMDVEIKDLLNGSVIRQVGLSKFPKKRYADRSKYLFLSTLTYVSVRDVREMVRRKHDGQEQCKLDLTRCRLGVDGVAENKSGVGLLDVVALQFEGCATPYVIRIFRAERGGRKANVDEVIMPVARELIELGITLLSLHSDAMWEMRPAWASDSGWLPSL